MGDPDDVFGDQGVHNGRCVTGPVKELWHDPTRDPSPGTSTSSSATRPAGTGTGGRGVIDAGRTIASTSCLGHHRGVKPSRTVPRAASVVPAVVLVLALGACGPTVDPPSPTPTTTSTTSTTVDTPPPSDCAADLPYPLTFTPETLPELLLNQHLSGCTDGTSTELRIADTSPVPWVLDQPSRKWTSLDADDPEVATLRYVLRSEDGLVIAPGESITLAFPPEQLHLALTPESAAAWRGLRTVTEQIRGKAESQAVELLADGRPARRAALTCGLEGAKFAEELSAANVDGDSATDQLDTSLGLARSGASSARACSTAIDDAERELAASAPDERPLLTLEDARAGTLAERPRFTTAFGAALRRAAQSIHRL